VAWFEEVREPLVVPDLVIPEVTYLLAAGARTSVEAEFLRSLIWDSSPSNTLAAPTSSVPPNSSRPTPISLSGPWTPQS
jgi:hypothetical protein